MLCWVSNLDLSSLLDPEFSQCACDEQKREKAHELKSDITLWDFNSFSNNKLFLCVFLCRHIFGSSMKMMNLSERLLLTWRVSWLTFLLDYLSTCQIIQICNSVSCHVQNRWRLEENSENWWKSICKERVARTFPTSIEFCQRACSNQNIFMMKLCDW